MELITRDSDSKSFRIFQGKETRQIDGHLGTRAVPEAWYYEPADYEGDTLWSEPYDTAEAAIEATSDEE